MFLYIGLMLLLTACSTGKAEKGKPESLTEIITEGNRKEDEDMKHEIVTVKKVEENSMILENYKNEQFIVDSCDQYDTIFEEGQKVWLHYTEKSENGEGKYILSDLKITEAGPEVLMPLDE